MVAICRHDGHLLDDRLQRLLEPALPFTIHIVAILHKISGEHTEPCFGNGLYCCQCTTACILDGLCIHEVAVGHIDERKLTLIGIFCAEMCDRAPMVFVSHTPTIRRSRSKVGGKSLMADIAILLVFRQAGLANYIRCCTGINDSFRPLGRRRQGDNSFIEVGFGSISLGYELHFALKYTIVGKPAETHLCLGITVNCSYHAIWFGLGNKFLNLLTQVLKVSLTRVVGACLDCNLK